MPPELLAIFFGLASAASWGVGDFSGGFASKRTKSLSVVFISQLSGLMVLLGIAVFTKAPLPPLSNLLLAAGAGSLSVFGLIRFYQELANGRMGVVAPLTSLVTAALPVVFSIVVVGLPAPQQLAGFALGLLAVLLISRSAGGGRVRLADLGVILFMGGAFGLYFIIIGSVSKNSIVWPLLASRMTSMLVMTAIFLLSKQRPSAPRDQWPLLLLVGVLDVGGSSLYALAASVGRLDIAAVLASLYPAVTVLLARRVLDEQLNVGQWVGVGAALAAIVLITI
jgi:drug/metabolite transporter (DMT)-like permease